MALDIVTIEQPQFKTVLTTPTKKVSFPLKEADINLIEAMKETLFHLNGVGLAANQVNESKRILAIYIPKEASLLRDDAKPYPMHIMINPTYSPIDAKAMEAGFEGCYSVSHTMGKVPRYKQIKVTFYDEEGQLHQRTEQGFYARVIQHEIDHLNGLLITDRLTKDCVQGSFEDMLALRRAELSPEKQALFDKLRAQKEKSNAPGTEKK